MRSIAALLVSLSLIALTIAPSDAAGDKVLSNTRGDVAYSTAQTGSPRTPVAANASIALPDNDWALTGSDSQGALGLPDSSRILLGQNTAVQLQKFDQAGITTANFAVVGKVRFTVQHPAGARANYTFSTGTAQIAVRGTAGDISWDGNTLQVNCYELSDPALPIQITLADGSVFTLSAGQSLIAHFPLNPADPPHVQQVTKPLADTFAEFGTPPNAKALGLASKPWFAAGGWLLLIPIAIIIANPHHTDTAGPNSGSFPVGVSFKIKR